MQTWTTGSLQKLESVSTVHESVVVSGSSVISGCRLQNNNFFFPLMLPVQVRRNQPFHVSRQQNKRDSLVERFYEECQNERGQCELH